MQKIQFGLLVYDSEISKYTFNLRVWKKTFLFILLMAHNSYQLKLTLFLSSYTQLN